MPFLNWEQPSPTSLEPFFSPALVNRLTAKVDTGVVDFTSHVNSQAAKLISYFLETIPKDLNHFLQMMQPLVNPNLFSRISQNLADFDKLAGIPCTESFIQQREMGDWLKELSYIAFRHFETRKRTRFQSTTDPSTSSGGSTFGALVGSAQRYISRSTSYSVLSRKGTQTSSRSNFGLDGIEDLVSSSKVKQIHLKGQSITEAWQKCDTMVGPDMKMKDLLKTGFPFPWTPSQSGMHLVFHGTAKHFSSTPQNQEWCDSWQGQIRMAGSGNFSQMAPRNVPVVYTAFSALRAFLWAAFPEHLYTNVPSSTALAHMQTKWTSAKKEYLGIALFQFYVPTPTIQGFRFFTIPRGKETEWAEVTNVRAWADWIQLKRFHSEDEEGWADIIHGLEYDRQRDSLQKIEKDMSLWRTTWKENRAAQALSERYTSTLAISFELEQGESKSEPKPPSGRSRSSRKKDDREDKGNKKDSTFGGLRKKFSSLVSKGKEKSSGGGTPQS